MSKPRDLIPKKIAQDIPAIESQESVADPLVPCKFFHPMSNWTWFVIEYDPVDRMCFGLVDGLEEELGYFSLDELERLNVRGLGVERDLYWTPRPLSQCRKGI